MSLQGVLWHCIEMCESAASPMIDLQTQIQFFETKKSTRVDEHFSNRFFRKLSNRSSVEPTGSISPIDPNWTPTPYPRFFPSSSSFSNPTDIKSKARHGQGDGVAMVGWYGWLGEVWGRGGDP